MAEEPDLLISAGFSDAQLVRETNKVVAQFRKRGEEAQKAFQDAQGRVTNTTAARAHARDLDRLSKAYDPVYRAARKYEDEVRKLDRALDIGAVTQDEYTTHVARAAREMQQASTAAGNLGAASAGVGTNIAAMDRGVTAAERGAGRFRSQLQNSAFQLQDFVVQVQSGTRASTAFAQQAPQLLGGFGAAGAALGLLAALAVPVGAALLSMAGNGRSLEDQLKELTKSTDDYALAADRAAEPIDALRQRYGDLADEVQRANSIIATMSGIRARMDTLGAARSLSDGLGIDIRPTRTFGISDQEWAAVQTDLMDRLRAKTGATVEQADRLRMALTRLESSNGLEAVTKDGENLLSIISELSGNSGADQGFLWSWASQVEQVMRAAQTQIKATGKEFDDVMTRYQTDTEKLKRLSEDRATAQKMLDEAVKSGGEDAIRLQEERLHLIDQELLKTQRLALANDELFQAMQKRLQARIPGLVDGFVERATGSSLTQWGKDLEASQKGILDLIGSRESGGDYNATLDNGRWTGGQRNLVNMTLREILALQSSMRTPENRSLYGNGAGSSALGKYQITGRTLEGLINELGLSGDELFSRQMQDRLATQLVRRRLPQGVEGLRNEWEGLRGVAPAVIQQALGQQSIGRLDSELQQEQDQRIKDQIRDREELAKQAKAYGEQLSTNLVTEKQSAELAAQQASRVLEIKGRGLSEADEAAAIAQVTAEIERQRTIYALTAEAKQRNVDLDAKLADGSMTYREAILLLADAKATDIVLSQQRDQAMQSTAEKMQQIEDQSRKGSDALKGMFGSIIDGSLSAKDAVLKLVAEIAKVQALKGLMQLPGMGQFGSIIGGLLSFDGGGYTWDGPRSGGIDNKGGRLAILHPNETVLDHTRGQHAGGQFTFAPTINVGGNVTQDDIAQIKATMDHERRNFVQNVRSANSEISQRYG